MSTTSSTPATSPNPPLWHDAQRQAHFEAWLAPLVPAHALLPHSLRLASADASFRRYLRLDCAGGAHASLIVMDAPPDKEDCQPFVQVAQLMAQAGLRVPEVLAWDRAQGFMLLTDLGSHTLLQAMDLQAPPPLAHYLDAVEALVAWQKASQPGQLPPYDTALLMRELELFPQWYVGTYRGITLSEAQRKVMDQAFARIVDQQQVDALALQPVVVVQPVCIDQGDVAFPVLGDDFFGACLGLVSQLGQVRACLGEWHDIAGSKAHGWLLR